MSNDLEHAIATAAFAHMGQKDRAGQPYILHPLRVMMQMETEAERIIAVLHDVAEDSPEYPISRLMVEFGHEAGEALDALTKREGEEYDAYLTRVAPNPLAVTIKLADLHDNSDMSRLPRVTEQDLERRQKYQRAIRRLILPAFTETKE